MVKPQHRKCLDSWKETHQRAVYYFVLIHCLDTHVRNKLLSYMKHICIYFFVMAVSLTLINVMYAKKQINP